MRLSKLLAALHPELGHLRYALGNDDDPVIRGITYDSQSVVAGDLFFALRGAVVDGHDYLQQAIELGAAAVVVDQIPPGLDLRGRPVAVVNDSRRALAAAADETATWQQQAGAAVLEFLRRAVDADIAVEGRMWRRVSL